ncbi:MAG: hypothetical protein IIC21_03665, partial [Chloroflexi bacterium]|nr:hypothetical protein [Chloroflexota bacterium]
MQHMMSFVLGFCLMATTVPAETMATDAKSGDGVSILKKAEAAMKRIDRVTYNADVTATGWLKKFVRSAQGSVVLGQRSQWDIERFRCEVTIEDPDSEKALAFTAGSNGDVYFLVDPVAKTAYQDMDPMVLGSQGRHIQRVLMKGPVGPDPFAE